MRRTAALLTLTVMAAACGGDQDPVVDGAATTSITASGSAVTLAPGDTTVTTGPSDPAAGGEESPGESETAGDAQPGPAAQDPGPAAPSFPPPDAGRYAFRTTGTGRVGAAPLCGTNQPVDEATETVVEHLSATDARETSDGQTSVLRYLDDRVELLSLDLTMAPLQRHFEADPPVLYAPVPPTGQSWSWQLTDSTGATTIAQSSTGRGTERIQVAGGAVDALVIDTTITLSGDITGTIQLTTWVDPARRTGVRVRQVSNAAYSGFCFVADTTSELTGFTPT